MKNFDLEKDSLSSLNLALQSHNQSNNQTDWHVVNPRGQHAIAVGLDAPISVTIDGSVGYYCGGMNQQARIYVRGSAGPGIGENMMSGIVHVTGPEQGFTQPGTVIVCGDSHTATHGAFGSLALVLGREE